MVSVLKNIGPILITMLESWTDGKDISAGIWLSMAMLILGIFSSGSLCSFWVSVYLRVGVLACRCTMPHDFLFAPVTHSFFFLFLFLFYCFLSTSSFPLWHSLSQSVTIDPLRKFKNYISYALFVHKEPYFPFRNWDHDF